MKMLLQHPDVSPESEDTSAAQESVSAPVSPSPSLGHPSLSDSGLPTL